MNIVRLFALILLAVVLLPTGPVSAASTTTEITGVNNRSEIVTMAFKREGDDGSTSQSTSIPANGGAGVLCDYPAAYFFELREYNYTVDIYHSDGGLFCEISFKVENFYGLWPTINTYSINYKACNSDFSLERGLLLYDLYLYVEIE